MKCITLYKMSIFSLPDRINTSVRRIVVVVESTVKDKKEKIN